MLLLPAFELLEQVPIVLFYSYCVGVLRAKHLFINSQGALGERLGLVVLAPVPVEDCQVVEQVEGVGMIDPVLFLPDGERLLGKARSEPSSTKST